MLSSEFITYLDTLLHMDRNEDTYIPTTDQVSSQLLFSQPKYFPTHYYTTSFSTHAGITSSDRPSHHPGQ